MTTDKKAKSVERELPVKADCVGLAKLATNSRKGIWQMGDALRKLVPQTGIHWKHKKEKSSEAKAFEAVSFYVGIAPTTLKAYRNTAIAFKVEDRNMDINFSIYKELASLANTKGQYAKTVKWINANPTATAEDAKNHRKAINGSLEPVITKGTKPAPSVESSSDDGTTPNATATDVEGTLEMLNLATANIVNNRDLFADHENVIMACVNKLATELVPVS
tara:strand:- start:258 stop:917 length:660 start_codon:yes stop_codon:yes gene_type:complete